MFLGSDFVRLLPERIAYRVEAIMNFSSRSFWGDTYLSRFTLIENSLKTFVATPKNFLIGIGYHLGQEYYDRVGQHSLITDYLAWYGCIGLFMFYYIMASIRKLLIGSCDGKVEKIFANSIFAVYFFSSIMSNAFRPEVSVTAILMLSLCVSIFSCTKKI